jgi:hypothetical protein
MSDGHEGVRQFTQAISQGIAEHVNAPPQRKNQNRAEWGTGLLAGGTFGARFALPVHHNDATRDGSVTATCPSGNSTRHSMRPMRKAGRSSI